MNRLYIVISVLCAFLLILSYSFYTKARAERAEIQLKAAKGEIEALERRLIFSESEKNECLGELNKQNEKISLYRSEEEKNGEKLREEYKSLNKKYEGLKAEYEGKEKSCEEKITELNKVYREFLGEGKF